MEKAILTECVEMWYIDCLWCGWEVTKLEHVLYNDAQMDK